MGLRAVLEEATNALVDFGLVTGSKVLAAASSVVLTVRGDEDPDGHEELGECEVWGPAPVLYRPKPSTSAGQMEALFARLGDERVVIGTKDRRFQVSLEEGEVRVVAVGKDGARQAQVRLQADGVAIVEAVEVRIGAEGATETIGLGTAIKNHFSALKTYIDGHIHPAVTTATIGAGATLGVVTVSAPESASPSVPDVESRHKVEN